MQRTLVLNRHQCTCNDAHFRDVMVVDSRGMKIGLFSGCSLLHVVLYAIILCIYFLLVGTDHLFFVLKFHPFLYSQTSTKRPSIYSKEPKSVTTFN